VVAGSDATDHAQAYLDAGAEYVLIGEGEQTLGELLDHLLRRGLEKPPLDAILGLAFQRDGQLVITPRRPDLKDLDALPFPAWDQRFAGLVEHQDARLPFTSLQRADLILKGDTIDALRRAGAQRIWVGAESGSQKILDAMEKGTHVEDIYETARRLHAAGIEVGFFLQFGYPGETRQDVEKTLQMVRDCRPDDIRS